MLKHVNKITIVITLILTAHPIAAEAGHIEQVSGWAENVALDNHTPFIIRAKIDTGAENSSVHTLEYHTFVKEGREWVSFAIINKNKMTKRIEAPVLRYAKIKQKNGQPRNLRPVIMLGICMGNVYKKVEVNLVDRTNFNYPVLIGRSFLKGSFVVDADHKFITTPGCNK